MAQAAAQPKGFSNPDGTWFGSYILLFGPRLQMFEPEGNDGSYVVIAALFATAALPSMVLAWREKDI